MEIIYSKTIFSPSFFPPQNEIESNEFLSNGPEKKRQ